jgi:hypothetical protein
MFFIILFFLWYGLLFLLYVPFLRFCSPLYETRNRRDFTASSAHSLSHLLRNPHPLRSARSMIRFRHVLKNRPPTQYTQLNTQSDHQDQRESRSGSSRGATCHVEEQHSHAT